MSNLLELQVKALAQPLGSENAWNELGDGRVMFMAHTIRVVAALVSHDDQSMEDMESSTQVAVLLEDQITDDTPFVGENCCIVWNSIEQELSLCMMFANDFEYQVAWSALAATQHKPCPPIGKDFFAPSAADPNQEEPQQATDPVSAHAAYKDILAPEVVARLGYIERHAVALSLLENGHVQKPELYSDSSICTALLSLGHADLLERLVSPEVYPMFVAGLDPSSSAPAPWVVPPTLKGTLTVAAELETCLRTALCLHHLKHDVLPLGVEEDVIAMMDGVNHRLQNEVACSLLGDDALLKRAVDELLVIPVDDTTPQHPASRSATPTDAPSTTEPLKVVREMSSKAAEEHVADHLKFFTSIISLSISAFSKELVAPVMGKIYGHGLLEALSKVAERYTINVTQTPPIIVVAPSRQTSPETQGIMTSSTSSRPSSGSGTAKPAPPRGSSVAGRPPRHHGSRNGGRMYSLQVEKELARLLDATLVRLNEKQEEVAVNDFFRIPLLENTEAFSGIIAFLIRQMLMAPSEADVGRSANRERGVGNNALLLYHLLGMHDDEGSGSADRQLDPENDARRHEFHGYIIQQFLGPLCKGVDISRSGVVGPSSPTLYSEPSQGRTLSPAIIRLMEYLLRLANTDNRELLLSRISDPNSVVLSFVEKSMNQAAGPDGSSVGSDVVCGNLRFLRAVIHCICGPIKQPPLGNETDLNAAIADMKSEVMLPMDIPRTGGLDKKIITSVTKALAVDRSLFGSILNVYHARGGARKQGLLHCTIRSMLQTLATTEGQQAESLAMLVLLKHRALLPKTFIDSVEQRLLSGVIARLDIAPAVRPPDGRNSASPLLHGVGPLDISAASSSPQQSPLGGRFLVDELASPPDARQMEDIAAFPKKLRQAIGRLSPTPRGLVGEGEGAHPVPGSASPSNLHLLPIPRGTSPVHGALSMSPPPHAVKLDLDRSASPKPSDGGASEPEGDKSSAAKPTAPKQAKSSANGRGNGRNLGDGKPIMRSK